MKRYAVSTRRWDPLRWGAVLVISLLLCGAGPSTLAAASNIPMEDDRTVEAVAPAEPDAPAAPAAPHDAVEPGLWGWWKLDEIITTTTSPTTPDSSTSSHEGWLGDDGGDDQPSLSTTEVAPSVMDNTGSFYFDGGNEWISMHTGPSIASDDNFTLAAWIKWNKEGNKSVIFFQGRPEDNQGLHFGIDLDEPVIHPQIFTLKCGFWGNDLRYKPGNGSLYGSWHHVACVCDHDNGHARKLYIDGVLVASDAPSNWYVGSGHLWMGRKLPDSSQWDFAGYIDEARVYTRALTEAEIKGLAARSDAGNTCFSQPVNPSGATDGTVYASTDATAVQAAIDTLGAGGGKVRISGTCTGVNQFAYAFTRDSQPYIGVDFQTALVPTLNSGKSLTLEGGWDSTFTTRNAATSPTTLDAGDDGRVVYAPGTTGSLTLQDLTITGGDSNTSLERLFSVNTWTTLPGNGGALITSMPTTLTNVSVTNSRGGYNGGGISAAASLTMTGCTVSGNTTGYLNSATGYWQASGGGIYAASDLTMTNCTVTGNTALLGAASQGVSSIGGGIFAYGAHTLTNCQVTNNTAYQGGGLLAASGAGAISSSTFSGNRATSGSYTGPWDTWDVGGAIYLVNGALALTDSQILGNTADEDGGAIYMGGGTLTVSGGKIGYRDTGQGNTAAGDGGGVYQLGGTTTLNSTVLVYGNTAANGAGLYVAGGTLNVTDAKVGSTASGEGNVASANGGGVYVAASGTLQMSTTGASIGGNRAAQGAGVYVLGGTVTTTNGHISNNTATTAGGGVYVATGAVSLGSTSTSFNSAPDGAGLYIANGTATLSGGTTGYNNASTSGGGLYVAAGTVTVTGGSLTGNGATSGGGLHMTGGAVTLDAAAIVRDNSAMTGGGLSVAGGTLTATGTVIGGTIGDLYDSNSASTFGGGAYVSGAGVLNLSSVTLFDNFAGVNGGGLYVAGGTATVNRSTISNGSSGYGGGAASGGGTTTITNSTIASNTAAYSGGGVYATAGTINVRNCTLTANTATTAGGGASTAGGTVKLSFVTVTENQAPEGAGLYTYGGATTTTSDIIARNRTGASTYGSDVRKAGGTLTSGGGNVIGVGDIASFNAGDQTGVTDPGLDALRADGVHPLQSTSVAIDAGVCTVDGVTITEDQLGQTRPGGGGSQCDAGAFEVQTVTPNCIAKSGDDVWFGANASALQTAVDAADAGATILVAGTCKGAVTRDNDTRTLQIYRSVTLIGGYPPDKDVAWTQPDPLRYPTVLDANGLGGVVRVGKYGNTNSDIDVTLRYLTFTGGSLSNYAGVLVNGGVRANVEYCNITDNHTSDTGQGGGLSNWSGTLTVIGSFISNNSAQNGAGVFNNKGGSAAAVLVMNNNTITGNTASNVGGAIHSYYGSSTLQFNTITGNTAVSGPAIALNHGTTTLAANIIRDGDGSTNECWNYNSYGTLVSGGFNHIRGTCSTLGAAPGGRPDVLNDANIELGALDTNSGKTQNYLPTMSATNSVLDVVPVNACQELLGTTPLDQRGRQRPRLGWETHEKWCDVGSVERGQEILAVCGPPLLGVFDSGPAGRCHYTSVTTALIDAADDDIIVVSGVIQENVLLNKNVTLRGPLPSNNTPGTHMGFVQGASDRPTSCTTTADNSVVTVASNTTVTIEDLNIRNGCSKDGGGINNAGTLHLKRSTVYDSRASENGGGIYNSGTLEVTDSTLSGNAGGAGGAISNASGAALTVRRSTLTGNTATSGATLHNAGAATVGGSLLVASGSTNQCSGAFTLENNLVTGVACATATTLGANPNLGALRDNGGATLTYAIPLSSSAVGAGYASANANCAGQTDQRGRTRPEGSACDAGAYEYGPRTLTVDAAATQNPDALLFTDLQDALDQAMTSDIIAVRAGTYTGNFTAYRDVTIRHAGADVSKLSPELGYDLRTILQASARTPQEQKSVGTYAGTTLTVQGYAPSKTSIVATGDVSVTLQGLTIRHGAGSLGGGVHNLGALTVEGSTIEGNAAVGETGADGRGGGLYNAGDLTLRRSTISGNRAEQYGGALYNNGPTTAPSIQTELMAVTVAYNRASRLPDQYVIAVRSTGLDPVTQPIISGDEVRFQNQDSQAHTVEVQSTGTGISCVPSQIELPRAGQGVSEPMVCTTTSTGGTVVIEDTTFHLTFTLTLSAAPSAPDGASFFQTGHTDTTLKRSIVYSSGSAKPCSRGDGDKYATVLPQGNNIFGSEEGYGVAQYELCAKKSSDRIADPLLGPLQDNNAIDYAAGTITGYTYSHALLPASPAIDALDVTACGAEVKQLNLDAVTSASPGSLSVRAGDVVNWTSTNTFSVMVDDGQYNERLIYVPAHTPVRMQVNQPATLRYRVYDRSSLQTGYGTVQVAAYDSREVDQRGTGVPQRGSSGAYGCDIGAYEFVPWVVGLPLPRPPSASGKNAPQWAVSGASAGDYHAWSAAPMLDFAIRPTRPAVGGSPAEVAEVTWWLSNSAGGASMTQSGTVVWPDAPQLHVSGARVNLNHSGITDGFDVSEGGARAFEGYEPVEELAGTIVSGTVFTRTELVNQEGASYSVLEFTKSSQTSASLKVVVVKTLDWDTAGIRDRRDRVADDGYGVSDAAQTDCVIGRELAYPAYTDAAGADFTLPGHSDPEGRPGWILYGDAYDGVRTSGELATARNTVDNLIAPAHVREARAGPIIPVLDKAPAEGETDTRTDDDLRVAWYRPDSRNVAWPVKTVAYRCRWPVASKTPKIIIASELGSELGSQALLKTTQYLNPTVYHQTDTGQPGYSPNHEHALLAASNRGNTEPAFYALRTDLFNRNTNTANQYSYALLKYNDPRQSNRIQMAVYRVLLTKTPAAITSWATVNGAIGDTTVASPGGPTAGKVTLRVGTAIFGQNATATVPVEALNGAGLHAATVEVTFNSNDLKLVSCAPNTTKFVEHLSTPAVAADDYMLKGYVVHMRVTTTAGTDLRYKWNFGDGTVQYDDRVVSHVYGAAGNYDVTVTVSSGVLDEQTTTSAKVVHILNAYTSGQYPVLLGTEVTGKGCRAVTGTEGKVVLDLVTRSKHGLTGDARLADLTFQKASAPTWPSTVAVGTAAGGHTDPTLVGPDYSLLEYSLDAGLPIYAPTPMRGLLDIQPCAQTQASTGSTPFWKDWKKMLWARAAGDMTVQYFYPLQPGFYLDDTYARGLGLIDATTDETLTEAEQTGKCVPWLDSLVAYPTGTGRVTFEDYSGEEQQRMVYPVDYRVGWPQLPPLLNVGETVFQRAKGGVSAVASQVAVSRIYDDLASSTWDNAAGKVVMDPAGINKSVAQLIDPMSEVEVELPVTIEDNPSLPIEITTRPLLFGGGLSITGNANDPNLALPFSLRSRIVFRNTAADLDGDDVAHGRLVFKGYYDGTSPEYIKGDPLLLLNVMSDSDKERLLDLCPGTSADCTAYKASVEALYWKSHNPRDLDLCRDASGKLNSADLNPAANQGTQVASISVACGSGYYRDGVPDHALLIAVQDTATLDLYDANGNPGTDGAADTPDGIPEPFEGLGKGKALTAGNAAGTGYVTVAYNNDSSLGALPVSLQVIKVACAKNNLGEESPYRGNLLVIKSDNLFDEKLTIRHTGDFGGRPDNFTFQWWIAAVDDTGVSPKLIPPSYPWMNATEAADGPELTIEGANPTTLRDNWILVRYLNNTCPVCGNQFTWSALAGDPSAKPSEVKGQLAEGWIKRVTNALNPFDTRVDDFVSAPTNSTVDMIRQAGPRYEGPVAMNNDPDTLNNMGLIEAYQTVLERGRDLSIDAGVNDQGANAALLNITSRIASLYMLLANDAYMDALDPTVGLGTSSSLGVRAPALFAFANQFRADQFGLIDEELGLLRGRDETLGGVAAAPTYNRLTWNFTNGDGEVAYVMNYNIKDVNQDGFVNEADAAIMYPQGHGDAWGQFLTALTKYYELLRHQNYTWVPRAEPISVGGAPVVVDYYDERRFATAAAEKARMGAEIVDLAYRKYYADPASQEYVDTHIDASDGTKRAWGVADWAERAGQGAYFDWVVANAIIPPEDDRYSDVRKVDRTTVADIAEIASQYAAIEDKLDNADNLVNPLGLTGDAVLFDLDPALTKTTPSSEGKTHFEQVYDRSLSSLSNALKLYDYANEVKLTQRQAQDQQRDFSLAIYDEDKARVNELIEVFGYPYDADIGVNGTYPAGYDGPDIYNYDLIDRTEITDPETRCSDEERIPDPKTGQMKCPIETTTHIVEFAAMECLGNYVNTLTDYVYGFSYQVEDVCNPQLANATKMLTYTVGIGLDAGYGRYKPDSWSDTASRKSWGEIQRKMWGVYDAKNEYESALTAYQNQVQAIGEHYSAMKDRAAYLEKKNATNVDQKLAFLTIDQAVGWSTMAVKRFYGLKEDLWKLSQVGMLSAPFVVGIDNDPSSPVRATVGLSGWNSSEALSTVAVNMEAAVTSINLLKQVADTAVQIGMLDLDADQEMKQMGRDMAGLLRDERTLRLSVYLALDNYAGAWDDYKAETQLGYRKLEELIRLRKRWAGQISEMRYGDMAYRMYQNDALLKYRQQFDLAQTYTYLAAAAYDYETNLRGSDPAAGGKFLRDIVATRSLGELRWTTGPWNVEPIVGSGGLAEPLGKMRDNFAVLKGQMGFNNPQAEANRFSLRHELFRLRDESDSAWQQTLARYYTPDIFTDPTVAKLAKRPYGETGPEPGLVIPFGSTVTRKLNFFGNPLGPGDSAYSSTQFATKIASVGIWFDGYDTTRLAQTPRVYLLPGGQDVLRPRNSEGTLYYWNVTEQLMPLPYPITRQDMENPNWIPSINGLQGEFLKIKPYADMRAYVYTADLQPSEMNTDTRLIGRSVWNTDWVLVIPGATLLADPEMGIDRFIQDVDDIFVYFQTYAYAGTLAAAAEAPETAANEPGGETAALQPAAPALAPNPMPQPDVLFYGVALRDGTPLASGTLTAILPRLGTVTTEIGPIAGTRYNYVLSVPLGSYDTSDTNYAVESARVGETVRFTINGVPALLYDATGINYQAYPLAAAGTPYGVTVDVSGPGSYPIGDVNVSGRRDSADALLVLKYDVGLAQGVTAWPPGPGTVYLPLCDVTEDGRCNSSDALRILMCDVGLASCPPVTAAAMADGAALEAANPAHFTVEQEVDAAAGEVLCRVRAASPYTPLAAASLDLAYDPTRLAVVSCAENPTGRLDLAVCNPAYAEGTIRYTGITTGGIVEATTLLELRLRALDPAVLEQLAHTEEMQSGSSPAVELSVIAAFDLEGNALRPVIGGLPAADSPPGRLYLPLISAALPVAQTAPSTGTEGDGGAAPTAP